ncbi:MAG: class I SAM-dependent methyltransferase [Saprospiraceae bacterium]
MRNFIRNPEKIENTDYHPIHVFSINSIDTNIDTKVVEGFGDEWTKFNTFSDAEIKSLGMSYFDILDENVINKDSYIVDFGAGSGRFSKYLSDKVKFIEVLEPSNAIYEANNLLGDIQNVRLAKSSVGSAPYDDGSFDFGMSIGVLHHMPDTLAGLQQCVKKIKYNGWFLVYLYYNLDNRGFLYNSLFSLVNFIRKGISILPFGIRNITCELIALVFYLPVISFGRILKYFGLKRIARYLPLHYYQDKSFRIIRNDALDRFGTRIEKRFSKKEIEDMMLKCGLSNIRFSSHEPFWHAVGQKIQ